MGTTVRITDFLKHIPVRKQAALKSAGKTLSKIKKLLQTYAICHPTKRLSLKVIKAKNESNNWMYAGGQNANLMNAALKIAGTEVASHCIIKEWPSEDNDGCKLVALLPKEDAGKEYLSPFASQLSDCHRSLKSQQCWPVFQRRWKTFIQCKRDGARYNEDI